MSVSAYILVPIQKFNSMNEQISHGKSQEVAPQKDEGKTHEENSDEEEEKIIEEEAPSSETSQAEEKDEEEEEKLPDSKNGGQQQPLLSENMKSLVRKKRLANRHLVKLLEAIQKYEGKDSRLENVTKLAAAAVGQSKKVLPGEAEFYQMIIDKGLTYLIRNKSKIKKWIPNWYRID